MKLNNLVVALGLALAAPIPSALAALAVYESQGTFESALVGGKVWVDGLEAFANELDSGSTAVPLEFRSGLDVRAGGLSGAKGIQWVNPSAPPNTFGRKSHAGGEAFWEGGDGTASGFTVEFLSATSAFGFWGSDIGDFTEPGCDAEPDPKPDRCNAPIGKVLKLTFEFENNTSAEYEVMAGRGDGEELFLGFTSAVKIKSVTFTNLTNGADGQGFDYFMVGDRRADPDPDPVPEPGALALVSLALLGAGLTRRRKERKR